MASDQCHTLSHLRTSRDHTCFTSFNIQSIMNPMKHVLKRQKHGIQRIFETS